MTQSKMPVRLLAALIGAIAALAVLVPNASAATPAPGYEQFAGCPSPAENPAVEVCFRSVVTGGHFQMGSKDVDITAPLTLSGGYAGSEFFANSKGGLSPVKQLVPGGVIGITGLDWLVNFLHLEGLKLYAITELAGKPSPPAPGNFTLPVKVRLVNPVLGNNCYIGSDANPITLKFKTGKTSPPPPNEPITGVFPKITFGEDEIIRFEDGTFVDNSFAVPGASGCKLTLFGFIPISLNDLVNFQAGLPSPAGTNEAVQEFDGELTPVTTVYP